MKFTQPMIESDGEKYFISLGNNEKECFDSKDLALVRQRQIALLASLPTGESGEERYAMASAGVLAAYFDPESDQEGLYLLDLAGEKKAFSVKREDEKTEINILDEKNPLYPKYKDLIAAIDMPNGSGSLNLSGAVIDGQLIGNSHNHTVTIENGYGVTSEDNGHVHYVDAYDGFYVSYAPIMVGNLMLRHTHLIMAGE